jgi:hypothetical protein
LDEAVAPTVQPPAHSHGNQYQSFGGLTPSLIALGGAYLAVSVLNQFVTMVDALAFVMMIGFLQTGITIALVVVGAMWFYRAGRNADLLGAEGRTWAPLWGIFAWLIPVANAILPYFYVREVWKASDPKAGPHDWREGTVPSWFNAWWLLWGGAIALGYIMTGLIFVLTTGEAIAEIMSGGEPQPFDPTWVYVVGWVTLGMTALAYPLFIRVVKGLEERQEDRVRRSRAMADSSPPEMGAPTTRPFP